MSLRVSAYLQRYPQATAPQIAKALGISPRTVYRSKIRTTTPLPTWEVSELGLKVWLALEDVGTVTNLLHDLGVSRSTLNRGLLDLRSAGLVTSFRSPTTGKRVYRRLEKPVGDPFDVFSKPQEVEEFDPFEKPAGKKPKTGSVAETAQMFEEWARTTYPNTPYQTNRRALMGALGKARREYGITTYQETMALQTWMAKSPRPKGGYPLWKQFLAAYPALVQTIPATRPSREPVKARPVDQSAKQAQEAYEQTLEMAKDLDRELKDRDYPVYLDRYERGALYYQKVAKGSPLADPWDPSPTTEHHGAGGVVVDAGLSGQAQEGGGDAGQDDWSSYFEPDDSVEWELEDDSDQHSQV